MKINRIKEVLLEEGKTNNWLVRELDINKPTGFKGCVNTFQAMVENLMCIANITSNEI